MQSTIQYPAGIVEDAIALGIEHQVTREEARYLLTLVMDRERDVSADISATLSTLLVVLYSIGARLVID